MSKSAPLRYVALSNSVRSQCSMYSFLRTEEACMGKWSKGFALAAWSLAVTLFVCPDAGAQPYELTETEVSEVSQFNTPEVSLFGIKLGDTEDKVKDNLIKIKLPGVKVEVQDV